MERLQGQGGKFWKDFTYANDQMFFIVSLRIVQLELLKLVLFVTSIFWNYIQEGQNYNDFSLSEQDYLLESSLWCLLLYLAYFEDDFIKYLWPRHTHFD